MIKYITIILTALIIWGSIIIVQNKSQSFVLLQAQLEAETVKEAADKLEKLTLLKKEELAKCMTEANNGYYTYAKLNGKVDDKGIITAQRFVWAEAAVAKERAEDVCFNLNK